MTTTQLVQEIESRLAVIPHATARAAEYAYLGGDLDPADIYRHARGQVSHLIGELKKLHAELGDLASHEHDWSENDYCTICGNDGRA